MHKLSGVICLSHGWSCSMLSHRIIERFLGGVVSWRETEASFCVGKCWISCIVCFVAVSSDAWVQIPLLSPRDECVLVVELPFWDRQLTYLVRNVMFSLIVYNWYMLYIVVSRCAFRRTIYLYLFPTFWVRSHTIRIPSRRCIYWPDCQFNSRSNNVINSSQNCILYPVFNCINNIAHFPVKPFIETPFQGFHLYRTFLNR